MKKLSLFLLALGYLYPLCSGQVVRPSCNLNNCSRTNVEICATNNRQCRRFSNECSLESANCNATLATVWNRTDAIQCFNISANSTGSCSCPALSTCSNQTTAAGICTHRDGHACRLFRTECDLVRARCNRETWHNIDIMQCRGINFNQTRTCTCPKSLLCSRNETQLCVQVSANVCRLYDNECDLEGDRCRGERLLDVNNRHCQRFQVGMNEPCSCPALLTCQRNVTNICARNAANRCQLLRNQCEFEQQRCEGAVLIPTLAVQCSNIRVGGTGNCACPSLSTCSVNRTNICVRSRVGCRLKTNECELERSRCLGENFSPVNAIQCRGFLPGGGGPCACPLLDNCNRNNVSICVRTGQGCMLMRNECELEQARCEGRNFTIVDNIQCQNFTLNQLRNCSCPNMGVCAADSPNICVASSATQCRLLRNRCAVEKARCQGEDLNIVDALHCRGLSVNSTSNCSCPRLRNCSRNSSDICVRENNNHNTCLLLRNECALEQAICEGRHLRRVDNVHCRNFTGSLSRTCFCPNLRTCNRNSSSICVLSSAQCRLVRNECELEQAKCEGNNLTLTHAAQCLNFQTNQQSNCSCPNLLTCSQNSTRICVRTRAGCKLLTTQCELEESLCRGEALTTVDRIHCQGFLGREERSCFCPNLKTCSRNATNICIRTERNNCTLVGNECELELARCQGRALTILPKFHCLNFTLNTVRSCFCPNSFNCSTNLASTCVKTASGCKLLRNRCEVENERCRGPVQELSPLNCLGFSFGQTGNCSCPNLQTCSLNNTNICVKTETGCRLIENQCLLEQLRCQGRNLTVLPPVQCKLLQLGGEGACACPNWLSCQQNASRICAQTHGGCRLLQNTCELEQRLCQGESLRTTNILQCQGFASGELKRCACPELLTCSRNTSRRICVKNERNCTLMASSCDLELSKCRGEKWCGAEIEECGNFTVGQQGICTCPQLQTCSLSNVTNICVSLRGACRVMQNQCELERAKCNGEAWRNTNAVQCQDYRPNEWRWCACPRLLNCCNREKAFCVRGPRGCQLMKSDCELQFARCRGEVWTRADDLQCRGFALGQSVRNCTCPKLEICEENSSPLNSEQICVRNDKGCKLLRNDCELERLRCSGEVWHTVDNLQCQNASLHVTRSCRCAALDNCSNTTKVCGRGLRNQCYNFKTECDMRWAVCEGKKLSLTQPHRCQGIEFDDSDECKCPEARNCNRQRLTCGRRGNQCKLFSNECEFRKSNCRDENWRRINLSNCCEFRVNDVNICTRNMTSAVCAQNQNGRCRLFPARCDFNKANANESSVWSEIGRDSCRCLRRGRTGRCAIPTTCSPSDNRGRRVCGRQGRTFRYFRSQCHLRLHNYEQCTNFRSVRTRQCRRTSS